MVVMEKHLKSRIVTLEYIYIYIYIVRVFLFFSFSFFKEISILHCCRT
jgi:hypothetical protein